MVFQSPLFQWKDASLEYVPGNSNGSQGETPKIPAGRTKDSIVVVTEMDERGGYLSMQITTHILTKEVKMLVRHECNRKVYGGRHLEYEYSNRQPWWGNIVLFLGIAIAFLMVLGIVAILIMA
jgi:hypothetical protein